jgi:predicted amidophosphoribosyltransferase
MKSFCSSCGAKLTPGDRFCGDCGSSIVELCPTCGQEWDGIPVSDGVAQKKNGAKAPVTKESNKPVEPEVKIAVKAQAPSKVRITSAHQDPIYGPLYDAKSDCPNCGAKGQKRGTCKTCGFDS